jgi:hypothetical protein
MFLVLAFSKDNKFLTAWKDFDRVVVWDLPSQKFLCVVDTGQGGQFRNHFFRGFPTASPQQR